MMMSIVQRWTPLHLEDIIMTKFDSRHLALPKNWHQNIKLALIHVISLVFSTDRKLTPWADPSTGPVMTFNGKGRRWLRSLHDGETGRYEPGESVKRP